MPIPPACLANPSSSHSSDRLHAHIHTCTPIIRPTLPHGHLFGVSTCSGTQARAGRAACSMHATMGQGRAPALLSLCGPAVRSDGVTSQQRVLHANQRASGVGHCSDKGGRSRVHTRQGLYLIYILQYYCKSVLCAGACRTTPLPAMENAISEERTPHATVCIRVSRHVGQQPVVAVTAIAAAAPAAAHASIAAWRGVTATTIRLETPSAVECRELHVTDSVCTGYGSTHRA